MKIVCDIDGVIANPCDLVREHLLEDNKWNWEEYYKHTLEIPSIPSILGVINALSENGNFIHFSTGRPEIDRAPTEIWLRKYFSYSDGQSLLFMRPKGDTRPSIERKLEVCRDIKPDLVIEDEPGAVERLTSEGYIVLQVHGYRITEKDGIPNV